MGIPGVKRPWPRVTGSDGVGIVDAVGDGVDEAWIGRRVIMNAAHDLNAEAEPGDRPSAERFHLVGEAESGQVTSLVQCGPGASFPAHPHPGVKRY